MMALKLTSLAQGASGIRPQTLALLEAMFAHTRAARPDGDKRRLCAQQPQNAACTKAR